MLVAAEDRVTWATARSAGIPGSWEWPGNGLSPFPPRGTQPCRPVQTPHLQNCRTTWTCCLSHYVCDNLLQQL